jgi:hypothetical protein
MQDPAIATKGTPPSEKKRKRLVTSPTSKRRHLPPSVAKHPTKNKKQTDDDYDDGDSTEDEEDSRKPAAVDRPANVLAEDPLETSGEEAETVDEETEPVDEEVEPVDEDVNQLPAAELRHALIDAEERLGRAERQVRAISRTGLTDTFLEAHVRTWTKQTLWKKCKFITNNDTMKQVMRKACSHFRVPLAEQPHWMSSYSHIVRDGLNQKRNACIQDLRKTLKSKCRQLGLCDTTYLSHNVTELRIEYPTQLSIVQKINNVRGMQPNGDFEAFKLFFDELVPCVAGRKVWTLREKATKMISKAKGIVSVLDEAFAVLAMENYWSRWHTNGTARWTDSRAGNYQFQGWSDAAYVKFDCLCKRIRQQRTTDINKALEIRYLEHSRSLLTAGGAKARRPGVAGETNVEVYNELDSGED